MLSKKFSFLMVLIALLSLVITACNQGGSPEPTDESDQEETTENSEETKDNTENNKSDKDKKEETEKDKPSSEKKNNDSSEKQDDSDKQKIEDDGSANEKLLPVGTLSYGDKGEKVSMMQEALNRLGYSLTVDGDLGWTTVWAIKDFQAQVPALKIDGIYGEGTRENIQKAIDGELEVNPGTGLEKNEEQNDNEKNSNVVSNPSSILALVNKNNQLPASYVPKNLTNPNVRFPFTEDLPKKQMREVAASALERMFNAGDKAGVDLFAQSGYRSYDRQQAIFAANASEHGREAANQFSAQAGESEHQTGLTMDVTSADINYRLNTKFANTDEGEWVKKHASKYGFIIRYPKGKTSITGYQYEPWHLRYIGEKAAKYIDSNNITLEQYLGSQ
ncbi:D-alanyl-D-alanine carboxypeptidase family protein [Virgibacillus litoralis]|uniref:D-alanyl-D-alanine carboxypeptidase n=1 Tax=Virgibacillus litoralis TaxID=578221 RepID=A0ABS4HEB4_9BACI|nr:D-alanyl-D-alanine carboxypeptidase family protein [Virgibacillus litoralis]MBP1949256.1 D-alanyl-D-alanine carboxypeptidase [Virgibacillus litoralis]